MHEPLIKHPPLLSPIQDTRHEVAPTTIWPRPAQEITTETEKPDLKEIWTSRLKQNRFIAHLILFALIFGVISSGGIKLSAQQLTAPHYVVATSKNTVKPAKAIVVQTNTSNKLNLSGVLENRHEGLLLASAAPLTIIPDRTTQNRSTEIITYKVQAGDTIHDIATRFGLAPETILWANVGLENNPDLLSVNQELTILPVDGVYHQIGGGDTLEGIASTFKTSVEDIMNLEVNGLNPENPQIIAGQWLVVPGGIKPYTPQYVSAAMVNAPSGSLGGTGSFLWPTSGSISQNYWGRHRALDVSSWLGAPIYAADSGYVVAAGWDDSGYGRKIIIDHGNGFKTLYAHLSVLYVTVGSEVSRGQQIGEMGSTGNSTGPHLHFEVILNGSQRNPWGFLP